MRLTLALAAALSLICATRASAQTAGWTRPDLKPVSQPVVAGDRVVVYVAADKGLRLLGLDAASGRTVWSVRASASDITPGVAPTLMVAGGAAIYLAPVSGELAELAAVDAETGAERWRGDRGYFSGWPAPCAEAVCVPAELQAIGAFPGLHRFDGATGELRSIVAIGDAPRDVGEGLFDPGDRAPERLVAAGANGVTWSRPLAKLFGRGFSTDEGWNFGRYDALGLFVGSAGAHPASRGKRDVYDLAKAWTAGFRISDGRKLWRRPGWFECDILVCPVPNVGLRLVQRGTWSFPADALSRDARAVLEGFDLASGRPGGPSPPAATPISSRAPTSRRRPVRRRSS